MNAITTTNESSNIAKTEFSSVGIQVRTMDDLSRVSKMLSASGYFSDAKDAAQCAVKVLAGTEMGFGAFASMAGIHIIKGKPSIGANLMAAAVKRHPNYNYRVLEHSGDACRIEFFERWDGAMQSVGISEFTLAEAKKAGTQNLDKFAKNMLFARAMSNGVKWYCPDVFDAPVYTPDELGAEVNEDGDFVEAQTVEPTITQQEITAIRKFISDNGISPAEAMAITGGKKAHEILASDIEKVMLALNQLVAREKLQTPPEVMTPEELPITMNEVYS